MPTAPTVNLVNQRFSRLLVVSYVKGGKWLCKCDCGKECTPTTTSLIKETIKSCGCYKNEQTSTRSRTHGKTNTAEYSIWQGIHKRCRNSNCGCYDRYGGRGIFPCAGLNEFLPFLATVGLRPSRKHSIDRIDNDGGYWCGSCSECLSLGRSLNLRWATQSEQARNTIRNRRYTIDGEEKLITEWLEHYGIDASTVAVREKHGWSIEDALKTPIGVRRKNRKIDLRQRELIIERMRNGEKPSDDMAEECGMTKNALFLLAYRRGIHFGRNKKGNQCP